MQFRDNFLCSMCKKNAAHTCTCASACALAYVLVRVVLYFAQNYRCMSKTVPIWDYLRVHVHDCTVYFSYMVYNLSGDGNDICRSDRPRTVDPTMFLPFMQLTNHPDGNVRLGNSVCSHVSCAHAINYLSITYDFPRSFNLLLAQWCLSYNSPVHLLQRWWRAFGGCPVTSACAWQTAPLRSFSRPVYSCSATQTRVSESRSGTYKYTAKTVQS